MKAHKHQFATKYIAQKDRWTSAKALFGSKKTLNGVVAIFLPGASVQSQQTRFSGKQLTHRPQLTSKR